VTLSTSPKVATPKVSTTAAIKLPDGKLTDAAFGGFITKD